MKLRYKILSGAGVVLVVAVAALGMTLSYTSGCEPYPDVSSEQPTMKAITYTCYGSSCCSSLGREKLWWSMGRWGWEGRPIPRCSVPI